MHSRIMKRSGIALVCCTSWPRIGLGGMAETVESFWKKWKIDSGVLDGIR